MTKYFQIQNKCLSPEPLGYVSWEWRVPGIEVSWEGRSEFWIPYSELLPFISWEDLEEGCNLWWKGVFFHHNALRWPVTGKFHLWLSPQSWWQVSLGFCSRKWEGAWLWPDHLGFFPGHSATAVHRFSSYCPLRAAIEVWNKDGQSSFSVTATSQKDSRLSLTNKLLHLFWLVWPSWKRRNILSDLPLWINIHQWPRENSFFHQCICIHTKQPCLWNFMFLEWKWRIWHGEVWQAPFQLLSCLFWLNFIFTDTATLRMFSESYTSPESSALWTGMVVWDLKWAKRTHFFFFSCHFQ